MRLYQWQLELNLSDRVHVYSGDRSDRVHVYSRDLYKDRIDRAWWRFDTIDGILDAHILQHCYAQVTWTRLRQLLVIMYPDCWS